MVDAKNYSKSISKRELDQVFGYLKIWGAGLFGIIVSRKEPSKAVNCIIRETWMTEQKLIVVLSDNDVEQMLQLKKDGEKPELVIRSKIEDMRLGI